MTVSMFDRELKKGSADLLILSLIEVRPRHGYEMSKIIDERSEGSLHFNVASLYPLLYRLEKRGLIAGRWVEKPGQRRRRYYRITPAGRQVLKAHRSAWLEFVAAMNRITGLEHARLDAGSTRASERRRDRARARKRHRRRTRPAPARAL